MEQGPIDSKIENMERLRFEDLNGRVPSIKQDYYDKTHKVTKTRLIRPPPTHTWKAEIYEAMIHYRSIHLCSEYEHIIIRESMTNATDYFPTHAPGPTYGSDTVQNASDPYLQAEYEVRSSKKRKGRTKQTSRTTTSKLMKMTTRQRTERSQLQL